MVTFRKYDNSDWVSFWYKGGCIFEIEGIKENFIQEFADQLEAMIKTVEKKAIEDFRRKINKIE